MRCSPFPACLVFLLCLLPIANAFETAALTEAQRETYKLDRFYEKATEVEDVLIATSERVSDVTHAEAAYQFANLMRSIDKPVADRIRERKVLCLLIGHDELTSDLPQFKTDKTGKELDFYNWRKRGFLTWRDKRPVVVFAEEDVLEYQGGMQLESILIHEFAHVIHGAGFNKEQQDKLTAAYRASRDNDLWNDGRAAQRFRRVQGDTPVSLTAALANAFPTESPDLFEACLKAGDITVNGEKAAPDVKVTGEDKVVIHFGGPKRCYASSNRSEYWAEGLQCWYNTNRTMDHDHNHITTRAQLKAYDKPLAALCEEILGDGTWRFVSPRDRAGDDHLAGYDPAKAPVCVNAPHIKAAANDYYDGYWQPFWHRLYDKHQIDSPRTVPLFNGKNLDGWTADIPQADKKPDLKPSFVVRDDMVVSLGNPQGHLVNDTVRENYRLDVSYRFTGKPGNCGVLVHASTPRALYKMFPKSIEVQMYHKNAGDFWCIVQDISVPDMEKRRGKKANWGIVEGKARRILNLTDGSENDPGEWNEMRIECVGDEVKVWVNGDFVNHGFDCTASKGKIAIQAEGAEVAFRKMDFTPINMLSE